MNNVTAFAQANPSLASTGALFGLGIGAGFTAGTGALTSLALGSSLGSSGGALLGMGAFGIGIVTIIPIYFLVRKPVEWICEKCNMPPKLVTAIGAIFQLAATIFAVAALTWLIGGIGIGMTFTAALAFSAVQIGINITMIASICLLCVSCCACLSAWGRAAPSPQPATQ